MKEIKSSLTNTSRFFMVAALLMLLAIPVSILNAQGTVSDQQFFYGQAKDGWTGMGNVQVTLVRGQSKTNGISLFGKLGYRKGKSRTMLQLGYDYNKLTFPVTQQIAEAWGVGITSSYKLNSSISLQFITNRETDKVNYIYARYWLGSALMYRVVKHPPTQKMPPPLVLTLGTGVMWESEQFYNQDRTMKAGGAHSLLKAAGLVYLTWSIRQNVSLITSSYFLFAFEDLKDRHIKATIMLNVVLSKHFSFNSMLNYSFDNTVPIPGASKDQTVLSSGLTLTL